MSNLGDASKTFWKDRYTWIPRRWISADLRVARQSRAGVRGHPGRLKRRINEGNTPARTGLFNASFLDASNNAFVPTIPVALTTFDVGNSLFQQTNTATPPVLNLDINGILDPTRQDYNLIAESKGGNPNHVVVVDAHLDAIFGEGMLDNASGSATILDIA